MKNNIFKVANTLLLVFVWTMSTAQTPTHYYVHITTNKGDMTMKLYNETKGHRDNFASLVREGFFDSLLFHRVIEHFMIQGGDPNSRHAVERQRLGSGGPDYRVDAEIQEGLIHKRGAVGAARDNNPTKASSASQFYIVQGRLFSDAGLDSLEEFRLKRKLTELQRNTYKTSGGVPHLDGEYTVFGELMQGLNVVDSVAAQDTDEADRPLVDQHMMLRLLNRGEALDIELGPDGAHRQRGLFARIFGTRMTSDYSLD